MATSHQQQLLEGLLQDAEKGQNGASLSVQCNDANSNDDEKQTFYLHSSIATRSSGYFERFPDPASRFIQEIDASTFQECRKFMYTGTCNLAHDTVAAILAAADLLIMKDLTKACFDFLEHNLDHGNYQTVCDLAERFQYPQLEHVALRYSTSTKAKAELVLRKRQLASKIQETDASIDKLKSEMRALLRNLESVEERWTAILQADIDEATPPPAKNKEQEDSLSYPFNKARPLGAVGRLVVSPVDYLYCGGVTEYDPKADKADASYYRAKTPPPPTKEQYEDLGIICTYGSFENALEAAKPGDRIYLSEGTYNDFQRRYGMHDFNQSQEIVGLPGAEVILNLGGKTAFKVSRGSLRLAGLTLRYSENHEDEEAMIDFESENGELFIQDCTFDMGTNAALARSSRVSGVFLRRGKLARIEGNKFIGGGGSALTVINDPTLCFSRVEINRNVFINTGQPSFSEDHMMDSWDNSLWGRKSIPVPEDEVIPEPAAVELWRLNRDCYQSRRSRRWERYTTTTTVLSNNRFCQNMRAPLAYRALSGSCRDRPKPKPTTQLYLDLTGIDTNDITPGYNISLTDNVAENNGLGLDSKQVASWIMEEPAAKKQCVESGDEGSGSKEALNGIPDGMSLLSITHIVERHHKDFPSGFQYSEPYEGFGDDFSTQEDDY